MVLVYGNQITRAFEKFDFTTWSYQLGSKMTYITHLYAEQNF